MQHTCIAKKIRNGNEVIAEKQINYTTTRLIRNHTFIKSYYLNDGGSANCDEDTGWNTIYVFLYIFII